MSDHELIEVNGVPYLARGWMNGITAPIGTILGPNGLDEHLTVVQTEPNRVRLAHSRVTDFQKLGKEPNSVCEHGFITDRIRSGARKARMEVATHGALHPVRRGRHSRRR